MKGKKTPRKGPRKSIESLGRGFRCLSSSHLRFGSRHHFQRSKMSQTWRQLGQWGKGRIWRSTTWNGAKTLVNNRINYLYLNWWTPDFCTIKSIGILAPCWLSIHIFGGRILEQWRPWLTTLKVIFGSQRPGPSWHRKYLDVGWIERSGLVHVCFGKIIFFIVFEGCLMLL